MNVIKTGIWTVILILDIVSAVTVGGRTTSILGVLIDAVLYLSFVIPLIYGSVIFHRSRKEKKFYSPVDAPHNVRNDVHNLNTNDLSYPSQYKGFITEQPAAGIEAPTERPRRLSYNHTRDTRFESYRRERSIEAATFIFLHGFGDDAEGWVNIAQQFHSANKLPYLNWVFPNAPHNHEAMANAWYPLTSFSPIPVGRSAQSSSQDPAESDENDDDEPETESEILKSVEYICSLIDEEVKRGVSLKRIVVGGFSQGCAVSLVTGLASRYGGRIAGVVGLSGYLPHGKQIRREREGYVRVAREGERAMRMFLGHGTKDMLVPVSLFLRQHSSCFESISTSLNTSARYMKCDLLN
ncbi:putative acyl-protein thioesterase 1 [Halenospora varia]|nr:putative acyl-protein thioesterase 1 [Halenospora varia]